MKHITLGNTGIDISAIVFGGWQSGKGNWVGIEDTETIKAHQAALDNGITTFDTAEGYGSGHSEQVLAQAIGNRRDEIAILTKVGPGNLAAAKVAEACERSLTNLGTDRIDLYQIHWPAGTFNSPIVPIEETMGALVKLKDQGKIRAIGVSNFTAAQIEEATAFGRIDSVQPPYSLFWRQIERDVVPYALKNNLTVLAYSPLAQGLLTGKFGRDAHFEAGDIRLANVLFKGDNFERAQVALDKLRGIASAKGVSLTELALAWLTGQPQVVAIVGARNAEQATANANAGSVTLTAAEFAAIDAIGRAVSDPLANESPVQWQ
ncbi:MAG TPA: aldo/keto reductase [Capsulimonadaceae bacterium]|jgi:aryl-alcohol dehydrogenase-like predicted oxidoreductase